MRAPKLDQGLLKSLMNYDPDTGVFTWRHRSDVRKAWNTRYAGNVAGYDWKIGRVTYRSIRIFDWPFLAHRLAFLYMTGYWPAGVDHRDGNGLNNRWSNLRFASKTQNAQNAPAQRNGTGLKGVARLPGSKKFRAVIRANGKQWHLGTFATAEQAHEAYVIAAKKYFGEFARAS